MARYIRRFSRIGHSLGPSEERGFELWAGYEIESPVESPGAFGLVPVDEWSDERLEAIGVRVFKSATLEDLKRWTS